MARTGNLSGVVTAADTGAPIEGALILARGDRVGGPRGRGDNDGGGSGGIGLNALPGEDGNYLIDTTLTQDFALDPR